MSDRVVLFFWTIRAGVRVELTDFSVPAGAIPVDEERVTLDDPDGDPTEWRVLQRSWIYQVPSPTRPPPGPPRCSIKVERWGLREDLQRYFRLATSTTRTDAEDREVTDLLATLQRDGCDPGVKPVARHALPEGSPP